MTKREARKIATLCSAVWLRSLEEFNVASEAGYEASRKVERQRKRLARKLAARYDLDVYKLPGTEEEITRQVLNGEL